MKNTRIPILVTLVLLPAAITRGAPMSPSAKDISGNFSTVVNDSFVLLADTDNSNLLYYVPRRGAVAVQSPLSTSPIPRFQIFAQFPMYGIFAGQELAVMGGSLSTTGDLGALGHLQNEATSKGYTISAAPARTATTLFLSAGYLLPDGRLDVNCTVETLTITDASGNPRTIRVPHCYTGTDPSDPNHAYSIDTNVMYKYASLPARNKSVVAQDIAFQATTLPGWSTNLRNVMAVGGQWDNVLTAEIDWDIQTGNLTRQARFHINWQALFERASAYAGVHHWFLVDSDVKAFFQKLVQCSNENECGVRPEFLQANGTWGPTAPNDVNFVNVAQAFQRTIEYDLFNRVRTLTSPKYPPVSSSHYAVFTLRANYEKLMMSTNEIRYLTWNPGFEDFQAKTVLNISCLMDGFEMGRVAWNMADPGCRALLSQQ
jgi:hypothetical protein